MNGNLDNVTASFQRCRQDPDFISSQVDQVAGSMVETEKTINELDFATGLGELDNEVPEMLRREMVQE